MSKKKYFSLQSFPSFDQLDRVELLFIFGCAVALKRKGFITIWAETCRINGYFPDLRHCCILYQYPVRGKMRAKRAKTASTIHFMKNQMWFFALSVFTCIGDNVVHCKIACLNGNHKTNEHVEEKSKPNCLQPKLITYCLVCEVLLPGKYRKVTGVKTELV